MKRSGLRARAVALVFAGAAPALLALGVGALSERASAEAAARREALSVARAVAADQQSLIDSSRVLLAGIARLSHARTGGPECSSVLASLREANGTYANLGIARADGTVICSAIPFAAPMSIADRLYFREALAASAFAVGEYQIGRVTGEASLNTGYPIVDDAEVRGVAFAAIRLASLGERARRATLPAGSVVTIVDRNGTVLARAPDRERFVGRRFESARLTRAATSGEGTTNARGLDGVDRLFGHTPLPGAAGGTVSVAVGIPTRVAFAEANRERSVALLVLASVTLLAMLAGWLGSRRLVGPVQRLAEAARRLESGDMSARAALPAVGGEVGALARSFDEMAVSLERRLAALRYHTHHDPLTDLPNRRSLEEAVRGTPDSSTDAAVLLLNLSRFREVSHTLGPESGDLVVREAADRLRDLDRGGVMVARVGGNEFGILLENVDHGGAAVAAMNIIELFDTPMRLGGIEIDMHVRVGVAPVKRPADPNESIRRAEVAERECADRGLACLIYSEEHDPYTNQRLRLISGLRGAHERGEMRLVFQPVVDTHTGVPAHCEALLRWRHPALGDVPPHVFVPLAEQFGMIRSLTTWVLREAVREHKRWAALGIPLPVAVNISAYSLTDADLPATIDAILMREGVGPEAIALEITETAAMSHPEDALTILTTIAQRGIRIAVDDFGTGHSSLAYLSRLPIDTLKIDRSFISALDQDEDAGILVRSTIELAHKLRRTVVAEGVEDATTRTILRTAGCDLIQGFLIGTPMTTDRLVDWARRHMPAMAG